MNGNGHAVTNALSREQILQALDRVMEPVEVPEWGGVVYVRNLNGRARDKFEASRFRMRGKEVEVIHENTRATLLSLSLCDESGALLFTESDIAQLGEKSAAVLDRLFEVAQRISGLNRTIEDRAKNSDATQNGSSGID